MKEEDEMIYWGARMEISAGKTLRFFILLVGLASYK